MWTPESLQAEGPRYLAVVERIQRDIASGALRPGMQLPPQRELASALGVDLTTISRAYAEAQRRGLIAGQVGRGTFVRARSDGATNEGLRAADDAPVDLSRNFPSSAVIEEAERALAKTLEQLPASRTFAGLLDYQAHAGRLAHREAGAEWVARQGVRQPPEQIVITAGAQHAMTVILMAYAPAGTKVMAESLAYPAFNALAERFGLEVIGLPMDDEGILPDAFRAACRSGGRLLYCTPTLQNPTTATMSAGRREAIARIADEFGVFIVEDDVHGGLPREAPPALSSFLPDRSFYIATLSKTVAPGLRIAYVAAPGERATAQVTAGVSATSWMAVPLMAEIAARWIRDGVADRLLAAHRGEANERQAIAADLLAAFDWRAHPEAYYGWLSLPDGWSTAEFVMQARRRGVIVTPSDAFATGGVTSPAAVRLSLCAAPSPAALARALEQINLLLDSGPNAAASLL